MTETFANEGITLFEHKVTDKFTRFVMANDEASRTKTMRAARNAGFEVDGLRKDVQTFTKWNGFANVRVVTFSADKLFVDSHKAATKQAGVSGTVPMHMSLQEAGIRQRAGVRV